MHPQARCPQTPRNLTSLGAEAASAKQAGETTGCSTPLGPLSCLPSPAQSLEARNPFSVLIHPSPNWIGNTRCRRPRQCPKLACCTLHPSPIDRWGQPLLLGGCFFLGPLPFPCTHVCVPPVLPHHASPPRQQSHIPICTETQPHLLHCSCFTRMMPSTRGLLAYEDEWPASFFSQPATQQLTTHSF